jgi:hypothetical protein
VRRLTSYGRLSRAVAAAARRRRDRFRFFLAIALFVGIVGESLVAVYIAWVAPDGGLYHQDWDTVKDWLSLSAVPLAAAASIAAAFWFPTREID